MDGPLVNCQLMSYEPRIRVNQVHIAHPLESQHQHVDGGDGKQDVHADCIVMDTGYFFKTFLIHVDVWCPMQ